MKNIYRITVVVVLLLAVAVGNVYAGNDKRRGTAGATELLINPWAHGSGWGSVGIANVRGIDAFYSNIAGIAFVNKMEFAYTNTIYLGGKSGLRSGAGINAFGIAVRLFDRGVLAATVTAMNFGDIEVTTVESPDAGSNGTFKPSYMNINLAYAHSFTKSIHAGVNFKVVTEQTADIRGTGFAIDAGIQYVTGENDQLKFGMSLKNWGPSMSYKGVGHSFSYENAAGNDQSVEYRQASMELPTCLNIGASYDFLIHAADQRITAAASFTSNAFLKDNITLGLEYSLFNIMQLRAGYIFTFEKMDKASRTTANTGLCAGASVDVPLTKKKADGSVRPTLALEYSYRAAAPFKGSHSIGAAIKF
mgnify:CR=1 FL=1